MVQQKRPRRWFYALSILLFMAGAGLSVWSLTSTEMQRVVVPGKKELSLNKAGEYMVYYEFQSVIGKTFYRTGELSGIRVAVVSRQDQKEVPLEQPSGTYQYTIGNHAGTSLFKFTIETPGTYEILGWYDAGNKGSEVVLAVQEGGPGTAILFFVGGGVLAGVNSLIVFFLRRRSLKSTDSIP